MHLPDIFVGGNLFGYSVNRKSAERLLKSIAAKGFFGIDTADVYSSGASELIVGEIVTQNFARDDFFISTKAGIRNPADLPGLGTFKRLEQSLTGSLRRLNVDYVDMFSIQHPDPTVDFEETLEALNTLVSKGLAKCFGISNPTHRIFSSLPSTEVPVHVYGNWVKEERIMEARKELSDSSRILTYGVLGRGLLADDFSTPSNSKFSRIALNPKIRQERYSPTLKLAQLSLEKELRDQGLTRLDLVRSHVIQRGIIPIVGFRTLPQLKLFLGSDPDRETQGRALAVIAKCRRIFSAIRDVSFGEAERLAL